MQAEMERRVPKSFRNGLGIAFGFLAVGLLVKKLGIGDMAQQVRRMAGGVTVRGGIMGIRTAGMGADVTKEPGGTINVDLMITVVAIDAQNNQIIWPYSIWAFLLDGANSISSVCVPSICGNFTTLISGTSPQPIHLSLPVPANTAPGRYTVSVRLNAARSDAQGSPTTSLVSLADRNAPDQIVVRDQDGPTTIGGSIGSITLSQQGKMGRR